jgi:hypothetical protein
LLGFEINARIGTWTGTSETRKLIEYAILINDNEYRLNYTKNKISFVVHQNKFDMFVIRVEDKFFNIDALNNLIKESEGLKVLHDKGKEFIVNCQNVKLVKEIILCLKKSMRVN